MSFALSTSWNAPQHTTAGEIADEIKSIGIEVLELGFNLTKAIVEEFIKLKREGAVRIVSTHNICPIPDHLRPQEASPDYYSLASLDETERREAIKYTVRTIETACDLGAEAVVLHCGRVSGKEHIRQLMKLFDTEGKTSPRYRALKNKMIDERITQVRKHFDQLRFSLEALLKPAAELNVKLGIENRFYYLEIPSLDEIDVLLEDFKTESIGYWHDVGHAQVFDNLGLVDHREYLERLSGRLIGIHLHDVTGIQDHLAPGQGEFDFARLKPYIGEDTIKVIEAHQPATAGEIKNSVALLRHIFS